MSLLRRKAIIAMKRDALVAVDEGVIAGQAECVGRSQLRQVGLAVAPFVDRADRAPTRSIPSSRMPSGAAEASQLLGVHVDDFSTSSQSGSAVRSFCERRERVAIFVHDLAGDFHRPRVLRIVRRRLEPPSGCSTG